MRVWRGVAWRGAAASRLKTEQCSRGSVTHFAYLPDASLTIYGTTAALGSARAAGSGVALESEVGTQARLPFPCSQCSAAASAAASAVLRMCSLSEMHLKGSKLEGMKPV